VTHIWQLDSKTTKVPLLSAGRRTLTYKRVLEPIVTKTRSVL